MHVASFKGAWIETTQTASQVVEALSHPLRVRGLKRGQFAINGYDFGVASFKGAWIETRCTGAEEEFRLSHPLRVRGLKHQ